MAECVGGTIIDMSDLFSNTRRYDIHTLQQPKMAEVSETYPSDVMTVGYIYIYIHTHMQHACMHTYTK